MFMKNYIKIIISQKKKQYKMKKQKMQIKKLFIFIILISLIS